jgi:hypothetical protein
MKKVINRTKNAREFSAHVESKLVKRLRKLVRQNEREFKAMRLSLAEGR